MKPIGYLVMESCDDYEQALSLRTGKDLPPGGVLDWGSPAAVFTTRAAARAAINRTHHYALAFGLTSGPGVLPDRKNCSLRPVVLIDPEITQ